MYSLNFEHNNIDDIEKSNMINMINYLLSLMFKYHKLFLFCSSCTYVDFIHLFLNSQFKSALELIFIVICLADSK